jgi:hypothetical protein
VPALGRGIADIVSGKSDIPQDVVVDGRYMKRAAATSYRLNAGGGDVKDEQQDPAHADHPITGPAAVCSTRCLITSIVEAYPPKPAICIGNRREAYPADMEKLALSMFRLQSRRLKFPDFLP